MPVLQRGSQDSNRSGSTDHAAVNGVKREVPMSQSPSLGAVQLNSDVARSIEARPSPGVAVSAMPPPSRITPRIPSGSPHPQTLGLSSHVSNHHPSANAFDARWRQPGKGESP